MVAPRKPSKKALRGDICLRGGAASFLYNYYMQAIGNYVDPNIMYGILIAKDGEQGTEHDPGGLLRRQLAIDTVDCNGVFYCGDYIVEDVFFVDEPPYAADEFANDPDSEYIWPWPQYCQPLKADGFAAGEYSCWILGIPLEYYVIYPKVRVRLKDDINNWRRFTVYEYDTADFWIQPPDEGASFYFGDLVEFYPNFDPTSLDPLKPYTNWLPVDGDGNERLPYSEDPINGYKSIIHTPPIGPNFSITLEDDDFGLKAYHTYCVGEQEYGEIPAPIHINGSERPPPTPPPSSISFDERSFELSPYDSLSGPYEAHRQYVNLDKIQPEDGPPPANRDDWVRVRVTIINLSLNSWVRFEFRDIPIQPQSDPPFPWDPNLPSQPGDNLGAGAGFTEVGGSNPTATLDLPAQERIEVDFHTSHFGGDNYILQVGLYDRNPSEPGAIVLGSDESPPIEVWRYYYINIYALDNGDDGSFDPLNYNLSIVQGKFSSGYTEFSFPQLSFVTELTGYSTNTAEYWDAAELQADPYPGLSYGLILDYVTDIPGNDKYTPQAYFDHPFHTPDASDYHLPPHHVLLQGADSIINLEDRNLGGDATNWVYRDGAYELNDEHVCVFVAIGWYEFIDYDLIEPPLPEDVKNPQIQIQRATCHEFGHCLVFLQDILPQDNSIMDYNNCLRSSDYFHFNSNDIQELRTGPYFDEL